MKEQTMSKYLDIAKKIARAHARELGLTSHIENVIQDTEHAHAIIHMDNEPMTAKDWREFDNWLDDQEVCCEEMEKDKKYLTWVDEQYARMEQERLNGMLQYYEDEVQDRWGYGDADGIYSERELQF